MRQFNCGKHRTVKGVKAEIARLDPTIERFKFIGYIMATGEPLIETAWDERGKNINHRRYNLR